MAIISGRRSINLHSLGKSDDELASRSVAPGPFRTYSLVEPIAATVRLGIRDRNQVGNA